MTAVRCSSTFVPGDKLSILGLASCDVVCARVELSGVRCDRMRPSRLDADTRVDAHLALHMNKSAVMPPRGLVRLILALLLSG